ncbi:MAG: hypothetical protein U0T73_08360 [Chitinophagales bacterium]
MNHLKVYDLFKKRFSEEEAKIVIHYFESAMDERMQKQNEVFLKKEEKLDWVVAVNDLRTEMYKSIGDLRNEMHSSIGALRAEMHKSIGDLRAEMHKDMQDMRISLQRQIYIVGVAQFLAIVGSVMALLHFSGGK